MTPQQMVAQKLKAAGVNLISINDLRSAELNPGPSNQCKLYTFELAVDETSPYGIDAAAECILPLWHVPNNLPDKKIAGLDLNNPQHAAIYQIAQSVVFVDDIPVALNTILTGRDLYESRSCWLRLTDLEKRFVPAATRSIKHKFEIFMYSRHELYKMLISTDGTGLPPSNVPWATHISAKNCDMPNVDHERVFVFSRLIDIDGVQTVVSHAPTTPIKLTSLVDVKGDMTAEQKLDELDRVNEKRLAASKRLMYILDDYYSVSIADFVADYEADYCLTGE